MTQWFKIIDEIYIETNSYHANNPVDDDANKN